MVIEMGMFSHPFEVWIEEDFMQPGCALEGFREDHHTLCAFIKLAWKEYNPPTRRYRWVFWEDLTPIGGD